MSDYIVVLSEQAAEMLAKHARDERENLERCIKNYRPGGKDYGKKHPPESHDKWVKGWREQVQYWIEIEEAYEDANLANSGD